MSKPYHLCRFVCPRIYTQLTYILFVDCCTKNSDVVEYSVTEKPVTKGASF